MSEQQRPQQPDREDNAPSEPEDDSLLDTAPAGS
jgi:hypothetical protein